MIRIKRAFMEVLESFHRYEIFDDGKYNSLIEEIEKMARIPASRQAAISQESAMYRTHCLLAALLLHEFTHAYILAYFEIPDHTAEGPKEPWAPGDRANEQGWAFENFAFGSLVRPTTIFVPPMSYEYHILQSALALFGSFTTWQWDVWLGNEKGKYYKVKDSDRIGIKKEDIEPDRQYPVPQAWTQWLFSDDLWTNHILRFGLEAIKVPKILKWEVRRHNYGELGYHKTGEERWNTGENMTDRDWEDWLPTWDEFYLDGIPKADQIYTGTKWEP